MSSLQHVQHPIAEICLRAMTLDGAATRFTLEAERTLIAELAKERGKPSLKEAVLEVVLLAWFFDTRGAPEASKALLRVAASAETALLALGTSLDGLVRSEGVKRMEAAVGTETHKTPVGHGEAPASALKWWELKR